MNFQPMRQTGEAQFYASEDLCPPSDTDTFSAKNIRKCQREVRAIQRRLDTAVANGDKANIRRHFDHSPVDRMGVRRSTSHSQVQSNSNHGQSLVPQKHKFSLRQR